MTPAPVRAWAALDARGRVIPASVRDTRDAVRLAAGECTPVRVMIEVIEENGR